MSSSTTKEDGQREGEVQYVVLDVMIRKEVIRMQVDEEGEVCFFSHALEPGAELEDEDLDGAFGMYLVERERLAIERDGKRVEALIQEPLSIGPTLFHWDCQIMTVREHLAANPENIRRLTDFLVENEDQLLVTFQVDGERYYLRCDARDQILPRPPEAGSAVVEAQPETRSRSRGGN